MIPIARKNKGVLMTNMDMHGAIACNQLMAWEDSNGNLLRRLFPHIYKFKPKRGFGRMDERLEMNKGSTLKKVNLAYRYVTDKIAMVERPNGEWVTETDPEGKPMKLGEIMLNEMHLPASIRQSMKTLQAELNPLMGYVLVVILMSLLFLLLLGRFMKSDAVVYGKDYYCDLRTLTNAYRSESENSGSKRTKMPTINDVRCVFYCITIVL